MRRRAHDVEEDDGESRVAARRAMRMGSWAALTAISVGAAVIASLSETGSHRLAIAAAPAADPLRSMGPTGPSGRHFDAEVEARRLSEAVRLLAADRDRLLARISALERSLDDVTGSVPNAPPGGRLPGLSPLPP